MSGWCLDDLWKVMEGVSKLSDGCLQGKKRLSGGYKQRVCLASGKQAQSSQVRSSKVRSS